MMKFVCLVALACAVSVVSSVEVSDPKSAKMEVYMSVDGPLLSTDEITAELNSKDMTPVEAFNVLDRADPLQQDIFQGYYAEDFTKLNLGLIDDCNEWNLSLRWTLCNDLEESYDNSIIYRNLLNLCRDLNQKVAEWCADKMDYVEPPAAPEFDVFRTSRYGEEGVETVKSWLSDLGYKEKSDAIATKLSMVKDRTAKIFGDRTVEDFLKLNEFNFKQCSPAALKTRAQFVQSLTPKRTVEDESEFDLEFRVQAALHYYSSEVLSEVAKLCSQYEDHPQMDQMNDEFKGALNKAVAENEAAPAQEHYEVSGPTPMEKFLLALKPEVLEP